MPSRGPGIYLSMARGRLETRVASDGYTGLRCDESEDLLAMPVGVAVHGFQCLRALHVEMEIVLPREADPAVDLDRLATHVARRLAHVGLRHRRGQRRVLGLRVEGPRRVIHGGVGILDAQEHLGALVADGLERSDGLAELLADLRVAHA